MKLKRAIICSYVYFRFEYNFNVTMRRIAYALQIIIVVFSKSYLEEQWRKLIRFRITVLFRLLVR